MVTLIKLLSTYPDLSFPFKTERSRTGCVLGPYITSYYPRSKSSKLGVAYIAKVDGGLS